jgi:hypothetical protein
MREKVRRQRNWKGGRGRAPGRPPPHSGRRRAIIRAGRRGRPCPRGSPHAPAAFPRPPNPRVPAGGEAPAGGQDRVDAGAAAHWRHQARGLAHLQDAARQGAGRAASMRARARRLGHRETRAGAVAAAARARVRARIFSKTLRPRSASHGTLPLTPRPTPPHSPTPTPPHTPPPPPRSTSASGGSTRAACGSLRRSARCSRRTWRRWGLDRGFDRARFDRRATCTRSSPFTVAVRVRLHSPTSASS